MPMPRGRPAFNAVDVRYARTFVFGNAMRQRSAEEQVSGKVVDEMVSEQLVEVCRASRPSKRWCVVLIACAFDL